ncbi:Fanconi anemia group M protein isoform X1 [Vanessa atalanta]|uniref:Fanconi anemia group M protein isoform X1 n=1 Tax=Vanessa atalanta TaxID=42275 RepID=UPI001FCCE2F5|nr:Fanconi anemia group M protein isoform X1 [Vanessa atalanta]
MEINNDDLDEDEVFDESSVFAHFNNFSFRDTNGNKSNTESALDVSALCCDEEIKGYDKLTGKTWIYPTNYPIRDYQYNIIKAALLKNTLVSLPTGLGKTFIAAVVMFNFYRWYPTGKIIFMAPTRPLVAQQIEACYNIIALPRNDTVEMTGHMQLNKRKTNWITKRVIFATPQVIYNDIKSGICQGDKIRCLVVDEAHRAKGNYAYCQIMSTLTEMGHRIYRVLALSATPGSKVEDVVNVVKNLRIAHLELRNENSIDVVSYSHSRKINTVVIPLGAELTQLKKQYVEILDGYARRLKQLNILSHDVGNLTKGRVVMLYKEFQTTERGARHPQHNFIMKDFTLLIALYHGYELLVKHGSRVFLNYFDEHPEKSWIQADDKLTALLERLRDDLGVDPLLLDRSVLPDGTIPEIPQNLAFGHPKFYKLKEIMLEHFTNAKQKGQETKAIVFCEYRESVHLVHCLLLQCRPLIVPQMFVGQGTSGRDGKAAVSQKQQLRVMRGFRSGACNALVCTCVAEEGLDVGSVDLILCFDVSTRSPVRLVQRCGRTGRERGGQVFILVTEGKEHQTLKESMRQRDGLNQKILESKEVENSLYKTNPRMVPRDLTPECQKMYITVDKAKNKEDSERPKKGQTNLKSMLCRKESRGTSNQNEWIKKDDFDKIYPRGYRDCNFFAQPAAYFSMSKESIKQITNVDGGSLLNLSTWLEWQRNLQKTINIGHSEDTVILTAVLKISEGKNSDILPSTQISTIASQDPQSQNVFSSPVKTKPKQIKKKQKLPLIKSPSKKDGDIRTLFSTATKSTKNYTKLINDLGIHNDGNIPTRVINLLVDLCIQNTNVTKTCYICLNVCNCKMIQSIREKENLPFLMPINTEPNLPNIDLIDDLNVDSFLNYDNQTNNNDDRKDLNIDASKTDIENNIAQDTSNNFDIEIDFDSLSEQDSPVLEKVSQDRKLTNGNTNFDIGDIDDIFAESSPEIVSNIDDDQNNSKPKETLDYFRLNSIEDIFADSDDELPKSDTENNLPALISNSAFKTKIVVSPDGDTEERTNQRRAVRPPSPSILSGGIKINGQSTSPILCSQMRKPNTTRAISNQFQSSTPLNNGKADNLKATLNNERDLKNTSDKSMFTITELVDMINKTENENLSGLTTSNIGGRNINVQNRTTSPIISTQRDKTILMDTTVSDKQKVMTSQLPLPESIFISDSDDEDSTHEYAANTEKIKDGNTSNKRKIEIDNFASPYFNKEPNTEKENLSGLVISNICDEGRNEIVQNRTTSPIICTQRDKTIRMDVTQSDKQKVMTTLLPLSESILISDSDDEDGTKEHCLDIEKRKIENKPFKRKFEDDNFASSHFNKKQKLNKEHGQKLTLQKKVLAALTSNKFNNDSFGNNNTYANFVLTSPNTSPRLNLHKEYENPLLFKSQKCNDTEKIQSKLDKLQMYRRDAKCSPTNNILRDATNTSHLLNRRKIAFSDSDDDFVSNEKPQRKLKSNDVHANGVTKNKIRKKKKASEFLDLEAELSEDDEYGSGDELTDESVGSIIDFICDENITHDEEDIQAIYLKSVKSPVKGVFKIPQFTNKYKKADVLSQYIEENDTYEMDSFCVDSHVGLTQINEVSELELAEMLLEEKKRNKKFSKALPKITERNDESPVIKRKFKNVKRQISSDSDDSS